MVEGHIITDDIMRKLYETDLFREGLNIPEPLDIIDPDFVGVRDNKIFNSNKKPDSYQPGQPNGDGRTTHKSSRPKKSQEIPKIRDIFFNLSWKMLTLKHKGLLKDAQNGQPGLPLTTSERLGRGTGIGDRVPPVVEFSFLKDWKDWPEPVKDSCINSWMKNKPKMYEKIRANLFNERCNYNYATSSNIIGSSQTALLKEKYKTLCQQTENE